MKKKSTRKRIHFSLILISLFFLLGNLSAQEYDIELATPGSASVCGPEIDVAVTVVNPGGPDGIDVRLEFDLPTGVEVLAVEAPFSLVGDEVILGDIDSAKTVAFTATLQVNCEFAGNDLEILADIVNGGTGMGESESIQVVDADLSIPTSSPAVLPVYLGLETSVTPRVVNNGFGELSEFTYCVSNDLTALTLQSIIVGGIDITSGGGFTMGNQTCYSITSTEMQAAGIGPTFGQGESLFPVENWLVVECIEDQEEITRRVQYGCQGDLDCQNKPQSVFIATGVSFELSAPNIDATTVATTRPACYIDEPTVITIQLTNNGNAPAKNIRYSILTVGNGGRGMVIDVASISITDDQSNNDLSGNQTILSQVIANDCRGPAGVREVDIQVSDVDLDPGESVTLVYQLTASCDCNSCDIRNKYWSRFALEAYDDLCGNDLIEEQRLEPISRFDAFITGFPEGPSSIFSEEEACFTYYVTNMQLDWLSSNYPDSYLEAVFDLPCGMDFVPGSFAFTDRDGMIFTEESVSYTDVNTMGANDELAVRFSPSGRPGGFNYAGGAQFDFCVTVDCSEKPEPACGNAFFDVVIDARFDFTTDPSCAAPCAVQKIWDPEDLNVRLVCPSMDPNCECDGITFTGLDIERTNFGVSDANNDQIPNGTITSDMLETDRFLTGDTIKATLQGIVNDADNDRDFDFGFVTYPFVHQNFTPLNATVEIFDASNGNANFVCSAVPITPDYVNMRIVVDFSRDALNNFGCGLPVDYLFETGDSIVVCLNYTEKDPITSDFRIIDYDPGFYLSENDFEQGPIYQCNPLIARMTQLGFSTEFAHNNDNFGSCEQPSWTIRYDRYIGGPGIDEFPNEIRSIGLPDRLVFTKPAEFSFRLDEWDVLIQQRIAPANNIVDTRGQASPSIPVEFFIVNGDEVTFLIGDYLESIGNSEIPPDEGYRVFIYPRIQGNCESVAGDYQYSYQFFEAVEENIFCTDEIANEPRTYNFNYQGAARLVVISDLENIRVCSGSDVATVRVRNLELPQATNAFLYPEQTGGVLINSIEDANTGDVIEPNEFGIYELGNIDGIDERVLDVYFRLNNCDPAEIDFIGGWACTGYPTTINDAICTDPSSLSLTSAPANVNMVVQEPSPQVNRIVDLCDPLTYELDILSSDLGYVRDIGLVIALPPNQSYVPGSMMFSNPSPALGGNFITVGDPDAIGNNRYRLDISGLDPILDSLGLVGSKEPENSVISIKFLAETECGYISGSRARFILSSKSACGDPLRNIRRRSGRIRLRPDEPTLSVSVEPANLSLNACNQDTTTTGVEVTIDAGMVSSVDSIRIILPEGVEYIPDTYVPGMNAVPGNNPGEIRSTSGQTILLWPFNIRLMEGDMITFDIDITVVDQGQACTEYDLIVQAFTSFEEECNGEICAVGELSGEGNQEITIQKADFDFNFIDGSISLSAADGTATADFEVKVTNFGFPLDAGNTVSIDIYEDINENGAFDEGEDIYLFTLDSTLVGPLGTGECIVLNETATFPAAGICTVIGVLDPDNTCTCSELPSSTLRPDIIFDFETEFDVCSGEMVIIGPDPIPGYTSTWLSLNGSDLSNLSETDDSPTVFTAPVNNSGVPVTVSYILRTANSPCFDDNIINITIAPSLAETQAVSACIGSSYDLPTVNDPNAANFSWMPAAGLTISPDGQFATINNVSASETYTLTYTIGGSGCPASFVIDLTAVDCGPTNTALGDTVWFDFNEDGIQDVTEPGIAGVTVNLIDANTGAIISTTQTDASGFYIFDMLPAGNYAVEFVPLPGFVFTQSNAGDDENDSDADPITGISPAVFLPLDEQNFSIDAGFIPDCSLELDFNVSECVVSGDTLARRITLNASWSGNPYTYDQFGDGNDTISIDFNGFIFPIVVSEIEGDSLVLDTIIGANAAATYSVNADFIEAMACVASASAGPFDPCTVDLALTKSASTLMPTPGPYNYGDLICMDIVVINQGSQTVDNVQIQDSLPSGFVFDQANSPGWIDIDPLQVFIFNDPIAPGQSATATICVTLEMVTGDTSAYTNIAEIFSFQDTLGNDISDFDEDSTPDNNFSNDAGGNPGSGSDDSVDGNGAGNPGDDDPLTDEDDSDPFEIEVFDLALVKMLDTEPFYAIGDIVTYSFQVINQGNIDAENINVIDYIPEGLSFESSMPPWGLVGTLNADYDTTSVNIPGPLAPGDTFVVNIDLRVVFSPGVFNRVNLGEITSATGPGGQPVMDVDSEYDQDPYNDGGGTPMSESDNSVDGDGTGDPGDTEADTDEDDSDPELMTIDSVSIGSTVFIDLNNNGLQDMGEDSVPGVTVQLYLDANGNMMIDPGEDSPIATTVTGDDGNYYFGMVVPGNYQVAIPDLNFGPGFSLNMFGTSSTPTALTDDNVDGNDDGTQNGSFNTTVSPVVRLIPTMEPEGVEEANFQGGDQDVESGQADANGNMTIDFGFLPNVGIGSTIFADYNDNGMQDSGEPGVPSVITYLYYDADGNGAIDGIETTPVDSTISDALGDYVFAGLAPGSYQVGIPASTFSPGGGLEFLPNSSTDIGTTIGDNETDSDDNGQQPDGEATFVFSSLIDLQPGLEITNADGESGQGTEKDNSFDASGDMTIDFGFLCNLELDVLQDNVTVCSARLLNLDGFASIFPANVNGTWTTNGDGDFLNGAGNVLSPARYSDVVSYRPGPEDARRGNTVLIITTDAAGVCPALEREIAVTVLRVDCGSFFWDGN